MTYTSYRAHYQKQSNGDGVLRLAIETGNIDPVDLQILVERTEKTMDIICGPGQWFSISASECNFPDVLNKEDCQRDGLVIDD